MKKIIIIGSGGAGKSTLAIKLGDILKLPVYHLDNYFWLPGWLQRNRADFNQIVKQLISKNTWIIDGNFQNTMPLRIEACDTVIFLDYSRFTCFLGAVRRYFRNKGESSPGMTQGCNEKLEWEYYKWLWKYPKKRKLIYDLLDIHKDKKKFLVFKNRKESDLFLKSLNCHATCFS
jgi:adenylate kinase family enzyme